MAGRSFYTPSNLTLSTVSGVAEQLLVYGVRKPIKLSSEY